MNLLSIKNGILCNGVRVDNMIISDILKRNRYFFDKNFSHSSSIILGGRLLVNVPLFHRFSRNSDFLLTRKGARFVLRQGQQQLCEFDIIPAPPWYEEEIAEGVKAADVIREHDKNVLSCNPFRDCVYFSSKDLKCKFCSYGHENDKELKTSRHPELYIKAITIAYKYNTNYELNFSIGTWPKPDRGASNVVDLIERIKPNVQLKNVSLEMAPPVDLSYIRYLKEAGVTSIMFNLELLDPQVRKWACPGKSKISIDQYIAAWREAVAVFGKWRVGSVLLGGMEPITSTQKAIDMLLDIGVLPIVMPFKPLDNSLLFNRALTSANQLKRIQTYLAQKIGINSEIQSILKQRGMGCLTCPGCSI